MTTFIAMPSATLRSSCKATRPACGALSIFSMVLGSAQCDATLADLRVAVSSDTYTLKVCCMLCVSENLVNVVRQSDGENRCWKCACVSNSADADDSTKRP